MARPVWVGLFLITVRWTGRSKKLGPVGAQFVSTFTAKLCKEKIHRNLGAYMTPAGSLYASLGLETMEGLLCTAGVHMSELAERLQYFPQIGG